MDWTTSTQMGGDLHSALQLGGLNLSLISSLRGLQESRTCLPGAQDKPALDSRASLLWKLHSISAFQRERNKSRLQASTLGTRVQSCPHVQRQGGRKACSLPVQHCLRAGTQGPGRQHIHIALFPFLSQLLPHIQTPRAVMNRGTKNSHHPCSKNILLQSPQCIEAITAHTVPFLLSWHYSNTLHMRERQRELSIHWVTL